MYPEDRVLVGVINRKRDFDKARYEHWYRVPEGRVPKGIYAEYVAFFFSRAFGDLNGGIHYYARRTGIELVRRRDLLPSEPDHPRADAIYYKLQFGDLRQKVPPVVNEDRRSIAFILTTWDRFSTARTVADLYSDAEGFVNRVFHALERAGVHAERIPPPGADGSRLLRIACEDGIVIASTRPQCANSILLGGSPSPDAVAASASEILAAVKARGGPLRRNDVRSDSEG